MKRAAFPFSLLFSAFLMTGVAFSACSEMDDDEDAYTITATGSGGQERPTPVSTPATGSVSASYNRISNRLTYTIQWSNLTAPPVAMHFHGPAGPEEVAPPVVGIMGFAGTVSGTYATSVILTEEQEGQLLSGNWYFNIHTPTFPAGEVRGQIIAR